MSFMRWISGRLTHERQSPHVQDAIRESEELLETKRRMITFTNDLDAGRLGGSQKVFHLRPNFMEQELLDRREPRWKNKRS